MLLSTQAFDQDPSTEAVGPQQRHELRRLARHHHIFMKMLFEDLHYMTELKTCADPAPGPTRRGLTIPLIVQPLLSRKTGTLENINTIITSGLETGHRILPQDRLG